MSALARRRQRWFYLLISPWLVGFLVFQAGPILAAVLLAFSDWPLPRPPRWVGWQNFQILAADPLFLRTLLNTCLYTLGSVPLNLLLGLGLALLVNRPGRLAAGMRGLYFLPVVLSGVATVLLWGWVFNPRYGLVNAILHAVGLPGLGWLQDARWAMPALILISLWTVGVNMLIYLAALQNVPAELREAAALDGAGRRAVFRHVTLPLISPVTYYLLVVNLIAAFQVFTPTYLLTRGGPDNATLTLPLYIYLNAFTLNRLGYAATLALVLFFAILALTLLQGRLAQRWVFYPGKSL